MGPLVPFIISDEFNLVIAVLVGIAFGFILEQAGFSSTKKLVGLFYGYDFTVLRVFFTAGVTAMAGVLLLGHYGLLDLSIIYINPTFLRSALVGGVVMGAGFIIGGFCPGTSVCAAAIGKLDAMAFLGGSLLGIIAFTEGYPILEKLYLADEIGQVRINDQLGLSMELFGFLLAFVAVAAFVATWIIENRVNKRPNDIPALQLRKYAVLAVMPFVILATVVILPGKEEIILSRIAEAKRQQTCVFKEINADKLASEIVNNYYQLNIIDVRSPEEYEAYHLPMAINIPFDQILDRQWEHIFKQRLKTNVFYADNDTLVKMSCLKAKFIGKSENLILKESSDEFRKMFFELQEPLPDASKHELEVYAFRSQSATGMQSLVNSLKNIGQPVKREVIKIQGGCS